MENNILRVVLWGMTVGRLYWNKDHKRAYFTFDQDFLTKGLDIAPLTASINSLQSQRGMPHAGNTDKIYSGLPEFISDSLPDNWGNAIFKQWASAHNLPIRQLTPVDRLAFIGKRSMGALEFEPAYESDNKPFAVELSSLYQLADKIFNERQEISLSSYEPIHIEHLYKVGSSAGGMRPKAIIAINEDNGDIRSSQAELPAEYVHYIIKFNEGKGFPFSLIEMAYYRMATAAGISMMPSRLIEIDGLQHFLTQRFDRENGEKVHIQTLAAMDSSANSYEDLFTVCRKLRLPAYEISEQYRRMAFNILAGNVDDHTKNFSFMMRKDGIWHITPAYDMLFTIDLDAPSYVNRHCLSVGGKDHAISRADLLQFARMNDIKDANSILDDICQAIAQFPEYAKDYGIEQKWIDRLLTAIPAAGR